MSAQKFPKSYGQRLADHFEQSGGKDFTLSEVQSMIKAFGQMEFKKRQATADVFTFGKYRGKKVSAVAPFDLQYLQWLYKQPMLDDKPALKAERKKFI